MPTVDKVAIIGLDCAEPSLLLDRWRADLPNLARLADTGLSGRLESCIPPITVPAWSCMATGRDPGALGIYGFRNRRDWSYENLGLATSLDLRYPRLWDYVGRAGQPSVVVGVPQTFPLTRPVRGCLLTCFLTPSDESPHTHPPELADELHRLVGTLQFDVEDFRTDDKAGLLGRIYDFAEQRFRICRHLISTRPWSLFWMVEMGVDRIHHAFWRMMDPAHRGYEPGNPFENAIHDYYVFIDRHVGRLLELLDLQRTAVWVVSDHGAQAMVGGVCFNDWLIRNGYLTLKTPATSPRRFNLADVDWSRTRAWGEGGYYGRCFINKAGREPLGIVSAADYEPLRAELVARLADMAGPDGTPLGTRALRPEDLYPTVNGFPPDLIVLFGDLRWRSVGTVGNPDVFTFENDTGPDDANHALHGVYVLSHPSLPVAVRDASIYDVCPTTLSLLGLRPPRGLPGRSLLPSSRTRTAARGTPKRPARG